MDPRAQGSRLARVPRLWFLWYPHSICGISALGSLVFMVPSWCLEAFGRLTAWATGLGISGILFLRSHQNPAQQTILKPTHFTAKLCRGRKSTPSHPKETKKTTNRTAPRLLPAWAKNNLLKTARPFGFLVLLILSPTALHAPRQIHNSGVAAATTGCLRLVPGKTLCEGTLKTKETEAEVPKML